MPALYRERRTPNQMALKTPFLAPLGLHLLMQIPKLPLGPSPRNTKLPKEDMFEDAG